MCVYIHVHMKQTVGTFSTSTMKEAYLQLLLHLFHVA